MLYCIGKFIRKRKLSDLGFDNFFDFGIIMIEDRRSVVYEYKKKYFYCAGFSRIFILA